MCFTFRSATVDSSLFARYFGDCPVINVEGRTHPVSSHFLEDVYEKMEYCLALDSPVSGAYFQQHGEKVYLTHFSFLMKFISCNSCRVTLTILSGLLDLMNIPLSSLYYDELYMS